MSDLISRAAAIDSVEIFLKQTDAPEVYPGLIPALARVINNVPSAQQVRTQMSSADCISRQDAIEAADRADYTGLAVEDVKKVTDEVVKEIKKLPSAQPETHEERTETHACDYINRKDAIDAHYEYCNKHPDAGFPVWSLKILEDLPSAQPEREDYTEMKREFIRMASYIDSLLVCPDEQKETLMNFISRLAEFMPWAERD